MRRLGWHNGERQAHQMHKMQLLDASRFGQEMSCGTQCVRRRMHGERSRLHLSAAGLEIATKRCQDPRHIFLLHMLELQPILITMTTERCILNVGPAWPTSRTSPLQGVVRCLCRCFFARALPKNQKRDDRKPDQKLLKST